MARIEEAVKNYQYITIDDDDLAQLKQQIASLGVSTAPTPNAPVYISTPGLQVGGHGIFETLGVSGLASVGGLGVGGGTTLGDSSLDTLIINATSTFQELATFNKGISTQAITNFNLSARSYFKMIKIARTIADLAGDENITVSHIAEALQYRPRAENYEL